MKVTNRPVLRGTSKVVATVAAASLMLVLSPASAATTGDQLTNHRGVPNNACGLDTPEASFVDRSAASAVHRRSIDCVADLGIAEGREGRYDPRQAVTRGQMASFIARTLEAAGDRPLPVHPPDRFTDTAGDTHEHRIDQLAAIGIVQGRSPGVYDPDGLVSRAQMASFLLRAASWNHDTTYGPVGDDLYFLDIEGDTHADAIRGGYELWLFEGRAPGEYDPSDPVSRGAMATFLTRLLDLIHPDIYRNDNLTYQMSPMDPTVAAPGDPIEFSVDARGVEHVDGGEPLPGPVRQALHIALFPCPNVTTDEPPATFAGDGTAAGIGSTPRGTAYISEVNGQPTQSQSVLVPDVAPVDGRISFTLVTPTGQPDCAVAVAFDDRAPVDQLRLDAGNRPVNPFGFVVARWGTDPIITVEPQCVTPGDDFTVTAAGLEPYVDYTFSIAPAPEGAEAGTTVTTDELGVAELPGTMPETAGTGRYTWSVTPVGGSDQLATDDVLVAEVCTAES